MSGLKPLSDKDRLYLEMKTIHVQLGRVLRDYEAVAFTNDRKEKPCLDVIDPSTGKPIKRSPRNGHSEAKRGKAGYGMARRGSERQVKANNQ
ncbi:MAG: hypothetical protein KQI81_14105 [Deltaproteobacteria bacterium]|nr:hypothetical protein [Deltaproteobacteria bacterium]